MDERLTRWLLATILAALLLLLSLPRARDSAPPAMVERGVLLAAGSIAAAVDTVTDFFVDIGDALRTRRQLQRDNRELTERVKRLEFENLGLRSAMGRLRVLEQAQGFQRNSEARVSPAEIVYRDDRSATPSWIVRAPSSQWRPGQPVLAETGVVGRVITGAHNLARVRPLTDFDHAMGAMIERTRRQGIVRGGGPSRLTLEYIPRGSDVRLGDRVVTSGTDGVFPRGLAIGEVVNVEETDELLLRVGVRPEVDFSTLEVVYLLQTQVVTPESVPVEGETEGEAR